jgi:hypothetical protein
LWTRLLKNVSNYLIAWLFIHSYYLFIYIK